MTSQSCRVEKIRNDAWALPRTQLCCCACHVDYLSMVEVKQIVTWEFDINPQSWPLLLIEQDLTGRVLKVIFLPLLLEYLAKNCIFFFFFAFEFHSQLTISKRFDWEIFGPLNWSRLIENLYTKISQKEKKTKIILIMVVHQLALKASYWKYIINEWDYFLMRLKKTVC